MSSWFYVRKWQMKRISYIGKELSYNDARSLFRALSGFGNGDRYCALLKKDNLWKVISSESDIGDWTVVSINCIKEKKNESN